MLVIAVVAALAMTRALAGACWRCGRRAGLAAVLLLAGVAAPPVCGAADTPPDYLLAPGDTVHIQVFQNPDMNLDTRVSETGYISFPLIGAVRIGGLSPFGAEREIARKLEGGGFVNKPQVTVVPNQIHGNQVSVLGQVNRAGRFPLDTSNIRLSEMLAVAGGIATAGADVAIITGIRNGHSFRKEVDIASVFLDNRVGDDLVLAGGDVIYVHRAPMFYIYGEAQRPGNYRVERGMTVQQALATGGGMTPRGTEARIRLSRRGPDGSLQVITPELSDPVQADDVLYVRESLF